MNRQVLSTAGIRYWMFRSNSVQVRDPKVVSEMIAELTQANVLVPADSRKLVGELVFNRRLPRIDADWTQQPVMLTQVGMQPDTRTDGKIPMAPKPTGEGTPSAPVAAGAATKAYDHGRAGKAALAAHARELIRLRDALEAEERDEARKAFDDAVKSSKSNDEPEVIHMSMREAVEKLGVVPA